MSYCRVCTQSWTWLVRCILPGMQSVIGSYESFEQAGAAVRSLERHLSIQDIVVADSGHAMWRKFGQVSRPGHATPRFLVVMTGTVSAVEEARELLGLMPSTGGANLANVTSP